MPYTANKFLRYSLLLADDTEMCGKSKLSAAWACDDENLSELAKKIRSDAADVLLKLRPFSDIEESITIGLVLIDILRRAGRFKEALELVKELKRFSVVTSDKDVSQIVDFQKKLCEAKDYNCYTFSDAYEIDQ
jgi:pentatricopeptide repeat protein